MCVLLEYIIAKFTVFGKALSIQVGIALGKRNSGMLSNYLWMLEFELHI